MQVIVGLGNPGNKYAHNRHNIGFMAVDRIAQDHDFAPWRNRFQGQCCEGRLGTEKVILLKPSTFMNRSGQSVGDICWWQTESNVGRMAHGIPKASHRLKGLGNAQVPLQAATAFKLLWEIKNDKNTTAE